jgi:hypothetical protein
MTDLAPEDFAPSIPTPPPARGYEITRAAKRYPRHEDIAQDGRVQLTSLLSGLSAIWHSLAGEGTYAALVAQRALPILNRLGYDGPFSILAPIHFQGTWRLLRERDGERIFLDMWLDAFAARGSAFEPPPAADAERFPVARLYAEHVITRPFDPPATRKVTRLDVPGFPAIPEDARAWFEAKALLGNHPVVPTRDVTFGVMHTDPNQHVNSLVYPRVFEETAIEALSAKTDLALPQRLLARGIEMRYRKPFFAGDRATIDLHPVSVSRERATVVGAFRPKEAGSAPSCTIGMWLA